MGEDFPIDPNQVQPPLEEQLDQQSQQGENAHIEVTYHDDSQDERVDDVDKAHDMALASDEDRTLGAQHRRAGNLAQETIDSLKARESQSTEEARARNYELDKLPRAESRIDDYDRIHSDVMHGADSYTPGRHSSQAEAHDRKAEQLEKWAGILHESPVSEEYLAAHPGIEFTPQALAALENLHDKELEAISQEKGMLETLPIELMFNSDPQFPDYASLVKSTMSSKDAWDSERKWRNLQRKDTTTVGQMRKMYTFTYEHYVLQPKEAKASLTANLLDDVASGRVAKTGEQES